MSQVSKVRSTVRTPNYSGTTTSSWSRPSLEGYGYDSVEDIPEDASPHPAEHSFLGEKDGETWSEVSVLPIVQPNGNLNKNALQSAKTYANQVEGISADTVENVKEKADMLLREEFDVEKEDQEKQDDYKVNSQEVEEFMASLYEGVSPADVRDTVADWGEYSGLDERELATLVGNYYDVRTGEALEVLSNLPEMQKEMRRMEKEELKDTVKKVRDGEMEVEEALDKFVDVDKEVIDEIKDELDKEEPDEEPEEEESEKSEDTEKEVTLEDKVNKVMEEEDVSKSEATVQVLDKNPELYTKYKSRGG